jgi:phosphohistidine phosphatase
MKTLYLLRHAKAERDAPSGDDYDRPLAARGRDDAARLGTVLKKTAEVLPDLILSSPSKRTLETVDCLTAKWPSAPDIQTDEKLYLAPASRLLEAVRRLPDTTAGAMLVGHNPGMEDLAIQLASKLAGDAPNEMLWRMRNKFPTCALATFEVSTERWARVGPDLARLVSFSTPKDLADSADA